MRATTLGHDDLLNLIRQHLPDFAFERAEGLESTGQFNTVLCLDERWIFRFPKSRHAAADLAHELEILPRLLGKLPLPIPQPQYSARDDNGQVLFMGYARLPGEPLLRRRYAQNWRRTRAWSSESPATWPVFC